jgi:hypothetical protein
MPLKERRAGFPKLISICIPSDFHCKRGSDRNNELGLWFLNTAMNMNMNTCDLLATFFQRFFSVCYYQDAMEIAFATGKISLLAQKRGM